MDEPHSLLRPPRSRLLALDAYGVHANEATELNADDADGEQGGAEMDPSHGESLGDADDGRADVGADVPPDAAGGGVHTEGDHVVRSERERGEGQQRGGARDG
eukprot:CAMPEP_0172540314 /NCGR_PEP_ID=MMETSP1067-20121228/11375_1 /TAXON_ID=265564 ORGANISM="Thalassiosira punctigera, Strain Tpunct2005C2" /NCGR_SAMPLE_ID=MMETSP1067 /ASSEMBLY_ACC=CAM_ASM_000444 /LENGTH=102 /DNA_ID=CAMNT_0013326169 /DNA_START=191 /DNA_END=494 /DNA_ORIENTATION=-